MLINVYISRKNLKHLFPQKVFVHQLDISDIQQVYKFAQNFTENHPKLNVLINNAGCMIHERNVVNGVELNFACNTLGTYVLTTELLPLLEKSEDPRVVSFFCVKFKQCFNCLNIIFSDLFMTVYYQYLFFYIKLNLYVL